MTATHRPPADEVLQAMEQAGIGHAMTDRNGVIRYISETFARQGQIDPDKLPDQPWYRLDAASAARQDMRGKIWAHMISCQKPWQGMIKWHLSESDIRFFEGTATQREDGTVILIMNDQTLKVRADRRIEDTVALNRQILRDLPLALAVTNLDGKTAYMNDYLPRLLRRPTEYFLGKTLSESIGSQLTERAEELVQKYFENEDNPEGLTITLTFGRRTGTWLAYARPLMDTNGRRIATVNLAFDQTERTRLYKEQTRLLEAMHEAQKISALHDFAGNLAHELSNILHPVAFYARKLTDASTKEHYTEFSKKINKGVMTAGQLLRRTLDLASRDTENTEPCDLQEILLETVESARDLAPSGLHYKTQLPDEPVMAEVGKDSFRQILLNLINNAAQAMNNMGTVTISLDSPSVQSSTHNQEANDTPFICLKVADEGPGIEPGVRDKLFYPFVTTKADGSGTGLGLSVVKSLVTGWGGRISVISEPNEGAVFCVWIPATFVR